MWYFGANNIVMLSRVKTNVQVYWDMNADDWHVLCEWLVSTMYWTCSFSLLLPFSVSLEMFNSYEKVWAAAKVSAFVRWICTVATCNRFISALKLYRFQFNEFCICQNICVCIYHTKFCLYPMSYGSKLSYSLQLSDNENVIVTTKYFWSNA